MRPPVVTAISTGTAVVHCIIGFWRWFIRLIRLVNLEREVVLVQYSVAIVFSPSYTLSLLFYSHVSRNHNSRNHKSQHSLSVAMLLAWHPTPRTAFGIRRVRGGLDVPHCILSDRLIYYLQRWCVKRLKSRKSYSSGSVPAPWQTVRRAVCQKRQRRSQFYVIS